MARVTRRKDDKVLTVPPPMESAKDISAPALAPSITKTAIAERAFEIYCARGRDDGHDLEDWLQAERELNA